MSRRAVRRTRRAGGFTIIELLVSVVVAGVALTGIYYYYATVQHTMREQSRISQAQLSARLGMELLAGDIQRAGYLATPNSRNDPLVCPNTPVQVQAVIHENGGAGKIFRSTDGAAPSASIPNLAQNANINPDDLKLYGNYVDAEEYLADIIEASGNIRLQPLTRYVDPEQADGGAGLLVPGITGAECEQLFPATALLRITNRHGFSQFVGISGSALCPGGAGGVQPTFQVNPPPLLYSPTQACGVEGWCEGCRVNVVNGVWYRIELDPGDATGIKTDLVRYYVDQNGAPITATREVVVEYAIDLQVWFRAAVAGVGGQPFDVDATHDLPVDSSVMVGAAGIAPDGTSTARPEALRSAIVRLTVRTRSEDAKFPFQARPNEAERIKSFKLAPGTEGSAHVRTYTTEVEMPNIGLRDLQ